MRALIVALMLLCGHAAAWGQHTVELGPVIVCDTTEQAERYARLRSDGVFDALDRVNTEFRSISACVSAVLLFFTQRQVKNVGNYDISEIVVLQAQTLNGLQRLMVPVIWYRIKRSKDIAI